MPKAAVVSTPDITAEPASLSPVRLLNNWRYTLRTCNCPDDPVDGITRWLVLTREPASDYPLDMFKNIAKTKPKPIKIWMSVKRGRWEPAIGGPVLAGAY